MTDREYLTHIIEVNDDLKRETENLEEETETLKRCIFEELDNDVTRTTIERIRRCLERMGRTTTIGALTVMSWKDERRKHE